METLLPHRISTFVGREQIMRGIGARLASARLVTLVGLGGIGKTSLAVAVAGQVAAEYPDGVAFMGLEGISEPELVAPSMLRALGLRADPGRDPAAMLGAALRGSRVLIVLDNCEHLLAACGDLVAAVLTATERVRVLATGREAMRIPGEVIWVVPPLRAPAAGAPLDVAAASEAVRLFTERATEAWPPFALTDANLADVVAICDRVEGIPLAIELAAARVRSMAPGDIVRELDGGALATWPRQGPPHRRTLASVLEWSRRLLPAVDGLLWERLAVFTGGFTLDAARAVVADEQVPAAQVGPGVARLVERSLVVREEGGRYRLLEPVRGYLARDGGSPGWRARHAAYYVNEARRRVGAFWEHGDWTGALLPFMRVEVANVLKAARWESDEALLLAWPLASHWLATGQLGYGFDNLTALLARHPPRGPSPQRAAALLAAGFCAMLRRQVSQAAPLIEEGVRVAALAGDPVILALGLLCQAQVLSPAEGARVRACGAQILAMPSPWHLRAIAHGILAIEDLAADDMAGAARHADEARAAARGREGTYAGAYVAGIRGVVDLSRGRPQSAVHELRRAVDFMDAAGMAANQGTFLSPLAAAYHRAGRGREALGCLRRALRFIRDTEFADAAELGWLFLVLAEGGWRDEAARMSGLVALQLQSTKNACLVRECRAAMAALPPPEAGGLDRRACVADLLKRLDARSGGPDALTPRERDLLRRLAAGCSNRAIAEALVLTEGTVKVYLSRIYAKLGVHSRTEAIHRMVNVRQ